MTGIARIAGQRFLNAFLDCLDGEVVADGRPAPRAERLEDDIGVREYPDFLHTVLTSQLERRGEVVLSEQLRQSTETKTHGLGRFAGRQPSVLQGFVKHLHEGGGEPFRWA